MYRVNLHLGAHKTATSHFRNLLTKNALLLDQFDLAVPEALLIRREITKLLPTLDPAQKLGEVQQGVAHRLSAGRSNIHILDENIIGSPARIFQERRMYPRAAMRIARALRLLPDCQTCLFLAVRNPASFVISAYLETVRNTGFLSFEHYLNHTPLQNIRWAGIVENIRDAAQNLPIYVWKYEDYHHLIPRLVSLVLGQEQTTPLKIHALDDVVRPSMSARAWSNMQRLDQQKNNRADARKIQSIIDQHPKSEFNPAPEILTKDQAKILNDNYRDDLAKIDALGGVTLLRP